jgi:hypothetical protein
MTPVRSPGRPQQFVAHLALSRARLDASPLRRDEPPRTTGQRAGPPNKGRRPRKSRSSTWFPSVPMHGTISPLTATFWRGTVSQRSSAPVGSRPAMDLPACASAGARPYRPPRSAGRQYRTHPRLAVLPQRRSASAEPQSWPWTAPRLRWTGQVRHRNALQQHGWRTSATSAHRSGAGESARAERGRRALPLQQASARADLTAGSTRAAANVPSLCARLPGSSTSRRCGTPVPGTTGCPGGEA